MATWHLAKITLHRILVAGKAEAGAQGGHFVARVLDGLWARHVMAEHKPVADTASRSGLVYSAKLLLYPKPAFFLPLFFLFHRLSFLHMISYSHDTLVSLQCL